VLKRQRSTSEPVGAISDYRAWDDEGGLTEGVGATICGMHLEESWLLYGRARVSCYAERYRVLTQYEQSSKRQRSTSEPVGAISDYRAWDDEGGLTEGVGACICADCGDLRLEARCAPGESMRACVDAALLLLDKAKSAQMNCDDRPGRSRCGGHRIAHPVCRRCRSDRVPPS
jgi:hypothetical protein